jgi:Fur family transcriptional regulator, peroxide stress response regulator
MIPNLTILSGETHIERNGVYKRSRLRERILEMLKSTGVHPTADWIYDRLKREFPKLSMGTVYRNLNILVEQKVTQKIDFGSTFDRFDGNIAPHYHFVCERCGSITDLELPVDDGLNERVQKATLFTVRRHRIEFYGVCDRCKGETESG